jgi:hypothetical protein
MFIQYTLFIVKGGKFLFWQDTINLFTDSRQLYIEMIYFFYTTATAFTEKNCVCVCVCVFVCISLFFCVCPSVRPSVRVGMPKSVTVAHFPTLYACPPRILN